MNKILFDSTIAIASLAVALMLGLLSFLSGMVYNYYTRMSLLDCSQKTKIETRDGEITGVNRDDLLKVYENVRKFTPETEVPTLYTKEHDITFTGLSLEKTAKLLKHPVEECKNMSHNDFVTQGV